MRQATRPAPPGRARAHRPRRARAAPSAISACTASRGALVRRARPTRSARPVPPAARRATDDRGERGVLLRQMLAGRGRDQPLEFRDQRLVARGAAAPRFRDRPVARTRPRPNAGAPKRAPRTSRCRRQAPTTDPAQPPLPGGSLRSSCAVIPSIRAATRSFFDGKVAIDRARRDAGARRDRHDLHRLEPVFRPRFRAPRRRRNRDAHSAAG